MKTLKELKNELTGIKELIEKGSYVAFGPDDEVVEDEEELKIILKTLIEEIDYRLSKKIFDYYQSDLMKFEENNQLKDYNDEKEVM